MKKMFTLLGIMLLGLSVMAADHKPVLVTVKNYNHYKVVIDGRPFYGDEITLRMNQFGNNRHTVQVFEMRRSYYGSQERLVDATSFYTDRNDVLIRIGWFGNIRVREMKNYRYYDRDDRRDRDYDRDDRRDRDNDRDDRRDRDNDRDNDRNDRPNRF